MNAVAGNNPYVGPRPFETKDRLYGREREVTELDHLLSAERIVLLYSPSGAGKSSLINAGIIPRLDWYYALKRDLPTAGRFDCWPPTRVNLPLPTDFKVKNRFAWSSAMGLEQEVPDEFRRSPAALADLSLKDAVAGRRRRSGAPAAVLLIFDQFEEFLRIDPLGVPEKEAFFDQLGELLHDPQIWALFVLREDYLAPLDAYSRRLPTHLTHRYRIDRLSCEAAAEAMEGPTQDSPRKFAPGVVEQLVKDLAQVQVQQPNGTFVAQTGLHVEPMHLQVVCIGLWDRMAPEDLLIDMDDVTTFGDVGKALANYYESSVARVAAGDAGNERRIRDWFDDHLITADGVRRQVLLGVDQSEGLPNTQIEKLQDTYLVRVEQRARATWFELAHDRLIKPVRRSNEEWRSRNLALFQRQAKLWAENARPDDMLFAGSELAEALRFAAGNPEGLSKADKAFLEKSKGMRDRIEAEQQRTREIEEKSREIADKNHEIRAKNERLRTWRLWLAIVGAMAIAAFVLTLYSLTEVERQKEDIKRQSAEIEKTNTQLEVRGLYGKLKRSVAMARGGDPAQALTQLIPLAADIAAGPQGTAALDALSGLSLESELDLGLIEVLGSRPPIIRRVGGHGHIVRALRFSDGGEILYSGGWDEKLKVWPQTGPDLAPRTLDDHDSDIYSLAYHGGKQILVSSDDAGMVKLWALQEVEPRLLGTLNADGAAHSGRIAAAALSPDGRWLATGGRDKRIVLWDLADPTQPKMQVAFGNHFHQTEIYRLAFIERGPWAGALVSGDWNGMIGIWRAPDARSEQNVKPDRRPVAKNAAGGEIAIFSLAVSPSGRWLAAGDNDGGIRAWDLESAAEPPKELLFPCQLGHRGRVFDMAFSPDGSSLATVGADGILLQWAIPNAAETPAGFAQGLRVKRFEGWGEKLHSVAFRPGPSLGLAVGGTKTVWVADPSRPNPLAAPIGSAGAGATDRGWSAITATPDLSFVAALRKGDEIARWRWDGEEYQAQPGLPIHAEWRLDRIALAPDGLTLVGLSCAGQTFVWSLEDPGSAPFWHSASPEDAVKAPQGCAVAFAPKGQGFQGFATGVGPLLRLWSRGDSAAWRCDGPVEVEDDVLALAFGPKGDRLAAAGRFQRILMWEIADARLSDSPRPSRDAVEQPVLALAFDLDDTRLVSGGEDSVAIDWALPELTRRSQAALHDRSLTGLAVGHIGSYSVLFSGDKEGQLVLCSRALRDERCARVGTARGKPILGLAGNPDLSRLLVLDDGLWVWDLRRQTMLDTVLRLSQ